MTALYILIDTVFSLYLWALFIYIVMSWLFVFQVINSYNQVVMTIYNFLNGIIEPAVRPIRRIIPPINGVDFAIIIFALGLYFIRNLILIDILGPMMLR